MSSMITKIAVTQMPETRPAALPTARRRLLPTSPWPVGRQLCPQAGGAGVTRGLDGGTAGDLSDLRRRVAVSGVRVTGLVTDPAAFFAPTGSAPTGSAPTVSARYEKHDPGTSVWRPPV
jgi:hypothetical protein